MVPNKYILKNPKKYEYCTDCRKYKICEICEIEFKHKQNRTCSAICAKKLKELSLIKSCGASHNFSRKSISRKKWEQKLLEEEGITNVFQREEVKNKSKKTLKKLYGVTHISKNDKIKERKKNKLEERIRKNPDYYKEIWMEVHNRLVNEIGYDPRLHVLGKASKESLKVFNVIMKYCLNNKIDQDDIYL